MLSYLFYPNPGNADYSSPKAMALLLACGLMVAASIGFSLWRKRMGNPVLRRVSKSWSTASLWFGLSGLLFIVARVEEIQFIAMRFLWVLWLIALALYLFFQVRTFHARYYQVIPSQPIFDPRDKYLPKTKR